MLRNSRTRFLLAVGCLCLFGVLTSGCQHRYVANRVYDLADIVQVGVGVTHENPKTGIIPPAYGLHVQATEFVNLGALHFSGQVYELDGRGLFSGRENRTRYGIGPIQILQIDQDVIGGDINYFKKIDSPWTKRMNSRAMRWWDKPAKELEYEYWADSLHIGAPIMHRGWQYWEHCSIEIGIPCPFVMHLGFLGILGFDPSEVSDFLLGFATVDFKNDDLTPKEFYGHTGTRGPAYAPKPASD